MKTQNLITTTLLTLAIGLSQSSSAFARSYSTKYEHSHQQFQDQAKVLKVKPIYQNRKIITPQQECWEQEVSYEEPVSVYDEYNEIPSSDEFDDNAGIVLGGLIGGAAGHQFGKGNGKKVATVVGSVIGAVVGNNMVKNNHHRRNQVKHHKHNRGHNYSEPQYETQCKTVNTYTQTKKLVGYKVKYKYQGHSFWTKTKNHPGKFLDINIKLKPLG